MRISPFRSHGDVSTRNSNSDTVQHKKNKLPTGSLVAIILIVTALICTSIVVGVTVAQNNQALTVPLIQSEETPTLPAPILVTTDQPGDPVKILIGDKEAAVVGVAAKANGILQPPQNVHQVGWDVHSSRPGAPGVVLITGHSDSFTEPGYAKTWPEMNKGDVIVLEGRNDSRWFYRVTQIKTVDKRSPFPKKLVSRRTGKPTLILATCSGDIIGSALGHRDNVFVIAELVGSRH